MSDPRNDPTDDVLLDYVSGRLSESEAAEIRAQADANPQIAADIALMSGARAVFETEADGPGDLGWARLSRAIDAEPSAAPSRSSRWVGFAATAAASVVAWQFLAVPLLHVGPGPGYAPVSQQTAGFAATVAFAPGVTEAALRSLLLDIGAEVTGGPSALGMWTIIFASDAARQEGIARLASAPEVESVQAE